MEWTARWWADWARSWAKRSRIATRKQEASNRRGPQRKKKKSKVIGVCSPFFTVLTGVPPSPTEPDLDMASRILARSKALALAAALSRAGADAAPPLAGARALSSLPRYPAAAGFPLGLGKVRSSRLPARLLLACGCFLADGIVGVGTYDVIYPREMMWLRCDLM